MRSSFTSFYCGKQNVTSIFDVRHNYLVEVRHRPRRVAFLLNVGSRRHSPNSAALYTDGMHDSVDRERLAAVGRGRRLEYITAAWNGLEGLVAIAAGVVAGSISLVGFGIDSFIEVASGCVLLWRMSVDWRIERREANERRALRVVGVCFLALAVYLAYESGSDLWARRAPEHSVAGIFLACASLVAMPLLSRAKRKVGTALGSAAMHADARQTEFCTYLSAVLLGGLVLNALFGLWWADPLAALVMVPIIAREGLEALRGRACACADA